MDEIETGYWTSESMEQYFSDFDEEPMTEADLAAERRSMEQEARDSMIGEMYAAQYSFD